MRFILNIVLAISLVVLASLTWFLRRDYTRRNAEILPGMVVSVPYNAFSENSNFPDGKTLQSPPPGILAKGFFPGRNLLTIRKATTVPIPAKRTMISKVTGTNAGMDLNGFPPTFTGQLVAEVQI